MQRSVAALASLAVLGFVGCSSSPGGGSSGSSGTGGGTGTGSGGSEPYYGTINFSAATEGTNTFYSVIAGFYASTGSPASSCPGTQSGSCCYIPHGTQVTPPAQVSAGAITLTDKGAQIGQLAFSGGSYAQLSSITTTSLAWSAGDTLGVSAAGAIVDAFTGSAVVPEAIAGINPMPSESTPLTVTDASGLTVTWTPGSGSSSFFLALEDISINVITCEVPITAGTVSVPSSLLSHLSGTGSIGVHAQSFSSFDGPNANLSILMVGNPVNGTAKFQ